MDPLRINAELLMPSNTLIFNFVLFCKLEKSIIDQLLSKDN